jgi:hypothetical protein
MPFDAPGQAYADKIAEFIADPSRYAALVLSSRDEFESALNWDVWGRSMRSVMERVLHRQIAVEGSASSTISYPPANSGEIDLTESLAAEVSRT